MSKLEHVEHYRHLQSEYFGAWSDKDLIDCITNVKKLDLPHNIDVFLSVESNVAKWTSAGSILLQMAATNVTIHGGHDSEIRIREYEYAHISENIISKSDHIDHDSYGYYDLPGYDGVIFRCTRLITKLPKDDRQPTSWEEVLSMESTVSVGSDSDDEEESEEEA
eukprot:6212993-Pleurochrysis_carterae.AAC.1